MRFFARLLVAFFVVVSGPAYAQAWTTAEVTPSWSSTVDWSPPITPDSTHPADAYEPAVDDETGYTRSLWITSENQRTHIGEVGGDGKFRTNCRPTFIKRGDPILYRGQYPAGHDHTFFGPMNQYVIDHVDEFNYQMGRDYPGSACQGGPLNTTLYWEPSVKDARYGLKLTVIPEIATFYYTHAGADGSVTTRLRRDFRFIGGANPANYNDTVRRAEYAAASLEYPGSPDTPAGFGGIQCYVSDVAQTVVGDARLKYPTGAYHTTEARYLKGPAGEDPWNGACTAGYIIVQVEAQDCWDGTNLASPDGRSHVRYSSRDEDNDPGGGQCPSNYVRVLRFTTKIQFNHNGWTQDLQYWYMSSDRMRMATAECPDETAPCDGTGLNTTVSKDPCRAIGVDFCPFSTAHFDWWGSWDTTVIENWEKNCGGLTIGGVTTNYADCGSGGIGTNSTIQYSGTPPEAGLSTNPVATTDVDTSSNSTEGQRYFAIVPGDENQDALELHTHS